MKALIPWPAFVLLFCHFLILKIIAKDVSEATRVHFWYEFENQKLKKINNSWWVEDRVSYNFKFFEYFKISIDTITFIFSSGVIAGAVIGSIVFLGVIIGVILCVVKKKGHRGTVIAPAAGGTHITQHSVAFGMSSFPPITHIHIYSLSANITHIQSY